MTYTASMQFTRNMHSLYDEEFSKFARFMHAREDFENVLLKLENAGPDTMAAHAAELRDYCSNEECVRLGITPEALIKDHSLLQKIPTRFERQEEILESFHNIYKQPPTPQQYMDRLTARLAPEYINDSVRMRILKKFLFETDSTFRKFDTEKIIQYALDHLSPDEEKEFSSLPESEKRNYLIQSIDESIFSDTGTSFPDSEMLKSIIEASVKYKKDCQDEAYQKYEKTHPGITREEYRKKFPEYPGIQLKQSTVNTIDDLLNQADISVNGLSQYDKLRLLSGHYDEITDKVQLHSCIEAITADFREQLHAVEYGDPRKNGKRKNLWDDKFDEALKKQRKIYNKDRTSVDQNLLKLCGDLADGIFRSGKTKENLYYFAFIFKMLPPDFNRQEYDTDLEILNKLQTGKVKKYHISRFINDCSTLAEMLDEDGISNLEELVNCFSRLDSQRIYDYRRLLLMTASLAAVFNQSEDPEAQKALVEENKHMDLEKLPRLFAEADQYAENRDIDKNIFHDYYNDNVSRYLEDSSSQKGAETEPDGRGINLNNFSEVIYLYYLSHAATQGKSPGELIDAAEEKINQCRASEKNRFNPDSIKNKNYPYLTEFHRDIFKDEILNAKEDDLVQLIIDNYQIRDDLNTRRILISSENHTAESEIRERLEELFNARDELADEDIQKKKEEKRKREEYRSSKKNDVEKKEEPDEAADVILEEENAFDAVNNRLKEKYKNDQSFCNIVEMLEKKMNESVREFYTQTKPYRERILAVLWVLKKETKKGVSVSSNTIQTRIQGYHMPMKEYSIAEIIKILQSIGYDIKVESKSNEKTKQRKSNEKTAKNDGRQGDSDKSYNYYSLNERFYPDCPELTSLLDILPNNIINLSKDSVVLLDKLITSAAAAGGHATRTALLSSCFRAYILDDYVEPSENMSNAVNAFREAMDASLIEAGFQPLSSKNLIDLYLITVYYFHITEANFS